MFACVYFSEDVSLSVVGKNDRKIMSLDGEWKEKQTLKMKWGKNLYSGTIIKIDDREDELHRFASAANNKILKKLDKKPEVIPKELFDFSIIVKTPEKRRRKPTEKAVLNEEQERNESEENTKKRKPSNKEGKTNTVKKANTGIPSKRKAEKKKTEDAASLQESEGMMRMAGSLIQSQFGNSEAVNPREDLNQAAASDSSAHAITDTPIGETWNLVQSVTETDSVSSASKIPVPPSEILSFFGCLSRPDVQEFISKFLNHFNKNVCGHESFYNCFETTPASPQDNFNCGDDSSLFTPVNNQYAQTSEHNPSTQHSTDIQNFNSQNNHDFNILPSQQQQQLSFTAHDQTASRHQQTDQSPYTQHTNPTTQSPRKKLRQPQPLATHSSQPPVTLYNLSLPRNQQNYISQHQTTIHQNQYESQNNREFNFTAGNFHEQAQHHRSPQTLPMQHHHMPSTSKPTYQTSFNHNADYTCTPSTSQPTHQTSTNHNADYTCTPSTSQPTYQTSSNHNADYTCTPSTSQPTYQTQFMSQMSPANHHTDNQQQTPRRSPRKTSPRKIVNMSSPNETVTLLEDSDVRVPRIPFKKATTKAKTSSQPGYALMMKLMPLIFTRQEMAISRGQGLTPATKDDVRPPLNKEKCDVLKEYVESWCTKHNVDVPTHRVLNKAITETVSYARKAIKSKK